jgi:hypothetical protein
MREWNDALASGDREWIAEARERILMGVHARIMDDDPNYHQAGYTPTD